MSERSDVSDVPLRFLSWKNPYVARVFEDVTNDLLDKRYIRDV